MSYLALARKWRPHQFSEVVGQGHVLTALENALSQNRLHHAYLFSGTRGVGKTTIGRLFAKGLNCETGITAKPCGECSTCKEIDEGRFVDLLEIDAASRTKVEDTRELLDNVQYKPARGRFKVYLIDEVHMLSRHSFNALLKTLEEPPEYVKFLLATTDPQKLPVTILSRCLQFHLKPISVDNIHQQLDHILGHEQITAEPRALGMISHAADGSMRDALSLTDQAIALGNGAIDTSTVSNMLGTLDTDQAIHLLEAISAHRAQTALDALTRLAQNGVDWDGLLQELATQLHRIAMYQALPATLDKGQPDAEKIELLAKALSPEEIQLYYQIVIKGREDIAIAPSVKMGAEMIVLRLIAFKPAGAKALPLNAQPEENKPKEETPTNNSSTLERPSSASANSGVQSPVDNKQHVSGASTALEPTSPADAAREKLKEVRNPAQQQQPASQFVSNEPAPDYGDMPNYGDYEQDTMPPQYDDPAYAQPSASAPNPSISKSSVSNQRNQPVSQSSAPVQQQSAPANPISGLRHQLRSRRNQAGSESKANTENRGIGASPKKASATPANKKQTAAERIAQFASAGQVSPANSSTIRSSNTSAEEKKAVNEPYQWKPSKPVEKPKKTELTPTQIKQALEHTKTPEMAAKLVDESVAADHWSALIQKLNTAKLVEQLALNSSYHKEGNAIHLTLRAAQAHLNTEKAQKDLAEALATALEEPCELIVKIGEEGESPLELRDKLYQSKLQQAHDSLAQDPHIQFITARFAAEIDADSVRPI
ncbi:DNA polymerase III subunit gamma/tau [Vibrio penaeicida]|uniref:DNA polymerase III subunit gamma/tau n=1 Tax=Vibrio penaeicida TaxID=104609 RepID=A0AAV5NYB6_9VIBR|nr:DNA polymerase III subunit gamma/tau [Vibrio penaeicida]RTZ19577.1 DNA polymerase III subunit gamma/tau [Vibrio penaeicida]GLQ75293.1 DNA polymerase III subunit gamma/tau [Vibrio penaeicida]